LQIRQHFPVFLIINIVYDQFAPFRVGVNELIILAPLRAWVIKDDQLAVKAKMKDPGLSSYEEMMRNLRITVRLPKQEKSPDNR